MIKIAIVGRPNVGKSTIFNRIAGSKQALVHDIAGLTRDRKEVRTEIANTEVVLVDTAGMERAETGSLQEKMMQQTEYAIAEADVILFVIDGRAGVTHEDEFFAKNLRRAKKSVLMVVNKSENENRAPGIFESFKLGFGNPISISAEHNLGFPDLFEEIIKILERKNLLKSKEEIEFDEKEEEEKAITVAIVGRPNVGKSTMFNSIIGQDRSITSDIAGTTRDSIYVEIQHQGTPIKLVDTAGIRKKHKTGDVLEFLSVDDSVKNLEYANIAVLVIDATLGFEKMDLSLTGQIFEEGKALVIAINKWDLLDKEQRDIIEENIKISLEYSLSQAKTCPIIRLSALNGKNVHKVLQACLDVHENWNRKISTSKLNTWLQQATNQNIPPICAGRRVKLKYMIQKSARPPSFLIFSTSSLVGFPDSYIRYLKNSIRETFDLWGTPIRITLSKQKNPYAEEGSTPEVTKVVSSD